VDEEQPSRRRPWTEGPAARSPVESAWLALSDDDLLFHISSLPQDHQSDDDLISIVLSARHFFVRQEAAKRVKDLVRLRELWDDRHVGQILVRGLNRREDVEYLQKLIAESRHIDVRNAAKAQLVAIEKKTNAKK
jgi:hypothetical protein